MQAFNGISSEFTVNLSESALARMLIIVRTKPGTVPEFDVREIEKQIVEGRAPLARSSRTTRSSRISVKSGETSCIIASETPFLPATARTVPSAKPSPTPRSWTTLGAEKKLAMNLYAGEKGSATPLRLEVFLSGEPVPLSLSLPMLEHMGVKVLEETELQGGARGKAAGLSP